jgi:hypothetical protein
MNKSISRFMSLIMMVALLLGSNTVTKASAAPSTYYVSATGSDTNFGSLSAPFRTLAKAASVLQAGDTLQVLPGIYMEPLNLSISGTASAPISVVGNNAVLNMKGIHANGITVSGSYVRVSMFEVTGATDFGILVTGKYVTIENNVLHDDVTRNGVGTCGISTSWGSALKVKMGAENTTIRNNTVYNNCGEGIAVTRGVTALIEGNRVWDNFGVNIYIDNSPFVTVQNNTSYCTGTHLRDGNRATGIALGEESYTGWGAQLHDILVSGNTITDCRKGISAYESAVGGTLTNVSILNNNIPSGQQRSISLQTLSNQNVLISNNTVFNSIYVYQPVGVILGLNTIVGSVPTSTSSPFPTSTSISPTTTPIATQPAATNTAASIASPTILATATPLTSTSTALPTYTSTSIPALPTFTATVVQPPVTATSVTASAGETTYDNEDSRFVYSSGWQNMNRKQAYSRSFKVTSQNGAHVTFPFTGQSFSILYSAGNSYRKMDVYVDGALVGTIDQESNSSAFQQRWDYPGRLAIGNHTLKLVFVTSDTSNRTNGSIDAVIVR